MRPPPSRFSSRSNGGDAGDGGGGSSERVEDVVVKEKISFGDSAPPSSWAERCAAALHVRSYISIYDVYAIRGVVGMSNLLIVGYILVWIRTDESENHYQQ